MEDEEYKKLPIDEKCVHKLWKARVNGYEEVTKLFRQIDDEKSPEFSKYLGLVKKFVVDSNVVGQEKGLEATLAFVENYAHAGKTVGEVMCGIVTKCIAAPKTRTKELALQLTLMYIEIEKGEAVQEELIKGMEQKNPKIVAACVNASTVALREFGSKIIPVKPLLKKIGVLLSDRDKAVRDETKLMIVEMYRWIGAALRPQLQAANLQPVQMTELETEFSKIEGQKAVPVRFIRSQQEKQAKMAAEVVDNGGEEEEDNDVPVEIDPYELADPVEILSKLPKDFYEKIEAKKWQDRKEALEAVEALVKVPKLENGDYGDLVRALKKVVQKDNNVICVAIAGRCIAGLANGLKKKFQQYSSFCVSAILEKFKEKKPNVVSAMRDAIDAVYPTISLEPILEDIVEALNNKNPSVKTETCLFLARAFTKTPPTSMNKKLLKAITSALLKTLGESDPGVREASAEALGTLMKLVGEKAIGPFLVELEKDNLKMAKIKEYFEKAVITVKVASVKSSRPITAPAKIGQSKNMSAMEKPPQKKNSAPVKKKAEISSGSATVVRSKGPKGLVKSSSQNIEREISDEEVDEIISTVLSANIIGDISSANWKERLAAAEQILTEIQGLDAKSVPTQAIVKFLAKKPGLKDTNFQVLKTKLEILKYLAENCKFSMTTANCCVTDISEKFSDNKNGSSVAETLTAIAEANSLGQISDIVLDFAFTQKSPKVQQEALLWLSGALKEFGISNLNVKLFIDISKKALSSTNPGVRQSVITLLGTMYLYMGATLNTFFENEKPAIRDLINAECDKYEGTKPPPPTRGIVKTASTDSLSINESDEPTEKEVVNIQDLIPKTDISNQITETIINELADKNWKVRNEAVGKISTIVQDAKFIKPNLGDLPQALALRLADSNVKVAQSALNLCEQISKAMGPPFRQYIKMFLPGCLQGLGDSKSMMRSTALETMNAFAEQCGYKDFFENEMIADVLKSGSPTLRIELWNWLAEVLPKIPPKGIPKEELLICIPHLYTNLEDRNADVRKNANEAILGIMIHLGYESMVKQTEKLKPGSKTVVIAALEKVRPNLPVKALPKKIEKEEKVVKGAKQLSNSKNTARPKSTVSAKAAPTSGNKKKDEDIDFSPLLVVNNLKHQRTIDESKLKVLKWNFTQPREEFVDLLKDQMAVANVNKTLMSNMFHSDFRYHIKAIESLSEDLAENSQALISNLDLILKWLTLRFFDTNPSVLLKGLEYLQSVFNTLINNHQYRMLDNEASAFIPYLVLKIGDPKDTVRNGVKMLLNQIGRLYPVSKLFTYVMEGVKSKNARQRSECLEVMGLIIEDFGITVCMPTPASCLKEVAKQISDRDNSVRNAALNCIVQAYNIVGEKVYKLVGNISDKDMSLLEERIKRSSRKTVVPKPELETTVVRTPTSPQKDNSPLNKHNVSNHSVPDENHDDQDEYVEEEEESLPPVTLPSQIIQERPKEIEGPFKLDPEFMQKLDNMKLTFQMPKFEEIDLAFLHEPIKIPTREEAKADVLATPTPSIPFAETITRRNVNVPKIPSPKQSDPTIERLIRQMSSANMTSAIMAMVQIQELLPQIKGDIMPEYEDDFMMAIVTQLKYLGNQDANVEVLVPKVYRNILTVMDSFYHNKSLGSHVSQNILKELMNQLITLLVEEKMTHVANGEAYVRVINLHCVKIIERSNHTNVTCALVRLINECISNDCSRRHVDLVMKCLWRIIKLMPSWGDEIDHEAVLFEIHNFLKKFPTTWWKSRDDDTPLRTIKTILHSWTKIKGGSMMLYLGKIPNTSESEVESYILRVLKSLKITDIQQPPPKAESHKKSLSRANHNMLTDIFQKIGNKDDTKEGLNLLYNFIQEQPEADIEPFLKKSSKFFQEYIKNGLKEIEESRKTAKTTIIEKVGDSNEASIVPNTASKGPEYWRQRLNYWNNAFDQLKGNNTIPNTD